MSGHRGAGAGWFAAWAATGALGAFGALCLISSLFPLLVVVGPLLWFVVARLHRSRAPEATRWGIALGLAALPFFLAYTNRQGPGWVCHPIGSPEFPGEKCAEYWDPRPFWTAAALLCLASVTGPLWTRRRRRALPS